MDVNARRTILRVKEILPSGVLLLEGKDGQEFRDHTKNCAPCHLPIEGIISPELAVVPTDYKCVVCGEKKVQQQYCCLINVKEVGIWHVLHRHCQYFLEENGFAHVARGHRVMHSL